jgi:hypothetical protein
MLPPSREFYMPQLSLKYRIKALSAEEAAKVAPDAATKVAWTEIAIEWHALATKTAVGLERDLEIS